MPSVNGHGLRARNVIFADRCMGEYTGEVVPGAANKLDNEYTQYHFDLDLSQSKTEDGDESIWWLDATKRGSIFRFVNHICDPNAQVDHGRCDMHSHILYVYTLRKIVKDEEITINYGEDWFSRDGESCRCGSVKCKNPPKKGGQGKKPATPKGKKESKDVDRTSEAPKGSLKVTSNGTPKGTPKRQETKKSTRVPRRSPRLASDPPTGRTASRGTTPVPAKTRGRLIRKPRAVMEDPGDEDVAPPKKKPSSPKKGAKDSDGPKNKS
jgi:hypothetical protein